MGKLLNIDEILFCNPLSLDFKSILDSFLCVGLLSTLLLSLVTLSISTDASAVTLTTELVVLFAIDCIRGNCMVDIRRVLLSDVTLGVCTSSIKFCRKERAGVLVEGGCLDCCGLNVAPVDVSFVTIDTLSIGVLFVSLLIIGFIISNLFPCASPFKSNGLELLVIRLLVSSLTRNRVSVFVDKSMDIGVSTISSFLGTGNASLPMAVAFNSLTQLVNGDVSNTLGFGDV